MKPNCSKHKKEVFGVSDMKVVAEAIGDLHYESLFEFVKELRLKLYEDGQKDFVGGRPELASALFEATSQLSYVSDAIERAWKASKNHMNQEK